MSTARSGPVAPVSHTDLPRMLRKHTLLQYYVCFSYHFVLSVLVLKSCDVLSLFPSLDISTLTEIFTN